MTGVLTTAPTVRGGLAVAAAGSVSVRTDEIPVQADGGPPFRRCEVQLRPADQELSRRRRAPGGGWQRKTIAKLFREARGLRRSRVLFTLESPLVLLLLRALLFLLTLVVKVVQAKVLGFLFLRGDGGRGRLGRSRAGRGRALPSFSPERRRERGRRF